MTRQAPELKPRGYGGILDATFDLYRQNFWTFAGIAGLAYLPLSMVQALAFSRMESDPMVAGPAMMGLGLLSLVLMVFVSGAMTKAVSDVYLGHTATIGGSYRYVLNRWLPYLWTNFFCWILVMAGMLLFVFPGILFLFWIAFAMECFVIEGRSGWSAVERSRELIAGQWVRLLVLGLLLSVLTQMLQTAPAMALGLAAAANPKLYTLSALWGGLANTLIRPVWMCALILLYYDIRIRKEAFDLEVLAENMAQWSGVTPKSFEAGAGEPAPSQAGPVEGEEPLAARFCTECGAALRPSVVFCEQCGQRIAEPEGTAG